MFKNLPFKKLKFNLLNLTFKNFLKPAVLELGVKDFIVKLKFKEMINFLSFIYITVIYIIYLTLYSIAWLFVKNNIKKCMFSN